jgi:seryl-tRNA synthetase
MLDIKFIRENIDRVKKSCENKQVEVDIDKLLKLDKQRRKTMLILDNFRGKKNKANKDIMSAKDAKDKKKIIVAMRAVDKQSDKAKKEFQKIDAEYNKLMLLVPNVVFDNVPVGKDDSENKVLREIGDKPKFDFESKNYMEIAENLDLIDVKRAAKVSGSRFGYLKNEAVLLEFALVNFAFDTLLKQGFVPVAPPVIVSERAMRAMGYLAHGGEEETYHFEKDKQYFVGTSEQSIGPMYMDEILNAEDLPKRFVSFSTCFRREAGTYGKDTKGILRVHQFDKLEMFSFCLPEKSKDEHKFFLSMEEKMMKDLKLPYRVIDICTGDLGDPAAAKYDIEAWIPSENKYRETHSASNCTDFQSRRLNTRYKERQAQKLDFVHTVNGTAFAIGRTIIAILENYQQKDGSVKIPKVLQKYIGIDKIFKK